MQLIIQVFYCTSEDCIKVNNSEINSLLFRGIHDCMLIYIYLMKLCSIEQQQNMLIKTCKEKNVAESMKSISFP